jgi:hypothetical protein
MGAGLQDPQLTVDTKPKKLLYNNLEELSAAKEYEKKIEAYKKDNFKYKKRDEDKSIDDKEKTKQLLKNIDLNKLFNRRSLLVTNPPKTTTAADNGV